MRWMRAREWNGEDEGFSSNVETDENTWVTIPFDYKKPNSK